MKPQPSPKPAEQPETPWLKNFISAPSDPAQLTLEDARAVFGGDLSALTDIVRIVLEVKPHDGLFEHLTVYLKGLENARLD